MRKEGKNRRAVALKYVPDADTAPRIVAKGKNRIADKILESAAENSVPVINDSVLADALQNVELNSPVPESLFVVVAEIYAFLKRVDQKYAQNIE